MLTRRSLLAAGAAVGAHALLPGRVFADQLTGDEFTGFQAAATRLFQTADEYAAVAAGQPPLAVIWMMAAVFDTPEDAAAALPLLTSAMQERLNTFSFLEWIGVSTFEEGFAAATPTEEIPDGVFVESYTLRPELQMIWMDSVNSPMGMARLDWTNQEKVYVTLAAAGSWGDSLRDYPFPTLGDAALTVLTDAAALTANLSLSADPATRESEDAPATGGAFSLLPDVADLDGFYFIDTEFDFIADVPAGLAEMVSGPLL